MVQQQEIMFRLTLYRALCVTCPHHCALLCICLLCAPLVSRGLLCNFCPVQPKRQRPNATATTECGPRDRCYSGRAFFGSVHFLSAQGCVSRELCGTVQPVTFMNATYPMNYTCCCRDRCNLWPRQYSTLLGMMPGSQGGVAMNVTVDDVTVDDCPEDNRLQEHSNNTGVGPGLKVLSALN
ncbi:hypothetical protein ANANG_G00144010 [Anguilla anguilla]|uniref:UPAR/Ly6 domain-containing protein n=1 Tax=Anguilla anguilla TaxID=7936 RepID=A0A9D3RWL6_ANGAN|nr:hypothetical protein ANANG_G00144010 [Anguilla anguilla]